MIVKWLEKICPWWMDKKFRFETIRRDDYVDELFKDNRLIAMLTGPRRIGKTFIMYSVVNELLKKGVSGNKIVFFTGEAREIEEYKLNKVIEEYLTKFKFSYKDRLYFFIDEVQEIKNWQKIIKYYYDISNFKFYLSGSSSLILNEHTSKLTGRFLRWRVLPLSFSEWLKFKKIKKVTENAVEDYLFEGGYPEYVLNGNTDYLRQAIESTLYRDLLSFYGIRNPAFLEDLLKYLADMVTNPVSLLKIKKDLKVDEKTARFYIKYLEDVFLVHSVFRQGRSNRIVKNSLPKYYFGDTGVLNILTINKKIGHLAENAVYLHLLRKKTDWTERPEIFYDYFDSKEVDFLVKDKKYEVKYRDEISSKDIRDYEQVGEMVNIITRKSKDSIGNLDFVSLSDFLLE